MKNILVVDDSKMIRKAIRRILETMQFRVDEASNGQEALDFCKQKVPSAVLLDIDMPVMDGITCLKNLRDEHSFQQLPIVMCTTHTSLNKIQEALGYGATEYIMKPFTDDIIQEKLQQVGLIG